MVKTKQTQHNQATGDSSVVIGGQSYELILTTRATASALNCPLYNVDMINILPCPTPVKQP